MFDGEFKILQQRLVGEKHLKMMVEPKLGGPLLDAIAFNVDTRYYPDLSIKNSETGVQIRHQRVSRQSRCPVTSGFILNL